MMTAEALVAHCERLYADTALGSVRDWKTRHPGRPAFGHLPVYAPREVVHMAGGLPVGIAGAGDQIDIVKGDACFQSYICHLPRSTVELGLTGDLDCLDGMLFPATCDVIRNLSGIWQLLFPKIRVRFIDLPQNFSGNLGGKFYLHDLQGVLADVIALGGRAPTVPQQAESIRAFNDNRRAIAALYDFRAEQPWNVPSDECDLVVRAGLVLEVSAHTQLVHDYLAAAKGRGRRKEDRIRVVMVGSFCEQPPLGLLRTLDRSGCYVVDDDLHLGQRWLEGDVEPGAAPLEALAQAYLTQSTWASTKYEADELRAPKLVAQLRRRGADGVVFAAPSFCDPALLDQPPLQKALTQEGIPFIAFKYAENTGQFQGIREQAGTFSDSLKLWGAA
jgi:benzoyl-CoA reductase subunit C